MAEVLTFPEGELWWVQASGSGRTWATAATPTSGLFAYVQDGSTFTSAMQITTIMERGVPDHYKFLQRDTIGLTFNIQWTGGRPSAASGGGASMPMLHLELKSKRSEHPGSAFYHQFHGVPIQSLQFTENGAGNTLALNTMALSMNGPTGSGYLS